MIIQCTALDFTVEPHPKIFDEMIGILFPAAGNCLTPGEIQRVCLAHRVMKTPNPIYSTSLVPYPIYSTSLVCVAGLHWFIDHLPFQVAGRTNHE